MQTHQSHNINDTWTYKDITLNYRNKIKNLIHHISDKCTHYRMEEDTWDEARSIK